MTDIEQKALALVKAVGAERQRSFYTRTINRRVDTDEALCRAIEQREATEKELRDFKQEVSDAVEAYANVDEANNWDSHKAWQDLASLIIPAPKPDPLVDVLLEMDLSSDPEEGQHDAKWLRIKLDALGFEIKEKNDDA